MVRSQERREPATGLEGSAFEALVGEHADSLYRFARSLVRDSAAAVKDNFASQLAPARPHDLLQLRQPEGDEEQAGLIDVPVVAVDDVDLRLVGVEGAAEPVGGHCPAGSAAEDHDLFPRHLLLPPMPCAHSLTAARSAGIRVFPDSGADNYSTA